MLECSNKKTFIFVSGALKCKNKINIHHLAPENLIIDFLLTRYEE